MCEDDFIFVLCVVVWDNVEEFIVEVVYQCDCNKVNSDFLEIYCVDNFEIDEC